MKKETFSEVVREILYHNDPPLLGKFGVEEEEYSAEATAILCYLKYVSDLRSLKWLVYEVFVNSYSKESIASVGDECYQCIAEEIWTVWQDNG
jgi:hypothetical protein